MSNENGAVANRQTAPFYFQLTFSVSTMINYVYSMSFLSKKGMTISAILLISDILHSKELLTTASAGTFFCTLIRLKNG